MGGTTITLPSTSKRMKIEVVGLLDNDVDRMSVMLRHSDLACVSMERERLAFEKECLHVDLENHQLKLDDRREEMRTQRNADLEKFKLMLDMFWERA